MVPVFVIALDGQIKIKAGEGLEAGKPKHQVKTYSSSCIAQGRPRVALTGLSRQTKTQKARFHSSSSAVMGRSRTLLRLCAPTSCANRIPIPTIVQHD